MEMQQADHNRSGVHAKRLVWTGTITSAASALVLPTAFFVISVVLSGTWTAFDLQYVVIYAVASAAATPLWAMLGAIAGLACWGCSSSLRHFRTRAVFLISATLSAIIVAFPTGLTLGGIFLKPFLGIIGGFVTALIAFFVAWWALRATFRERQ